VAGIVFGLLTLFWPGITAVVLLFLVAAWAIVTGIAELVAAIRLRGVIRNEWFLVLTAVASLIFGILLVINPGAGLLALVWLVGAYALVFGVLMLLLAYRLRSRRETGSAVGAAG
jgi:uncharacterized membrane protein HdeD (DUF308 family)